ncbi:MAG: hypothetical protein JRC90_09905, partial [Deltaproteobacteria bacterium]|nr:hypothetical protein [Deltaproteobacteria bacterium]
MANGGYYPVIQNSLEAALTAEINSTATTAPVDLCQYFIPAGWVHTDISAANPVMVVLGPDNADYTYPETVKITGISAASGAGNLTIVREIGGTATAGAARTWPIATKVAVVLTAQHIQQIHDTLNNLGYQNGIGVEWNKISSSPTLARTDRFGATITPSAGDFNLSPIWGQMRRCNLADDGTVNAWHGDADFAYDGSNGEVMVFIPSMYYYARLVDNDTKIRWAISERPQTDFKRHPSVIVDGRFIPGFYVGAFPGCAYDVTGAATEVDTIEILTEPTADGNLTLWLDENYSFTVAILDADTIEGVIDKIVAAGVKTDKQGITWTPLKVDATHVSYTAGSTGLKTTVTMPNVLGVTSTIVKTTPGAGGYVLNDSAGVDMTASTGDKLSSVAGVKPISGNQNTLTRANARILAENRGAGWQLLDFN